jgi:hypothetical protein
LFIGGNSTGIVKLAADHRLAAAGRAQVDRGGGGENRPRKFDDRNLAFVSVFLNATEVSPITSWVERNYTQVWLAGRRTSEVGAGGAVRQHRDSKHQPFTIALLTTFEAINAFPRTESGSPGVVSNKTELSVTNGATLGTLDDL